MLVLLKTHNVKSMHYLGSEHADLFGLTGLKKTFIICEDFDYGFHGILCGKDIILF